MAHVAVLLARFTLGGMWMIAGIAKFASPVPTSQAIEEFGLLRGRPAHLLGWSLPYLELTLGVLLVTGEGIRAAATISIGLLAAFSGAMLIILLKGKKVRCNCFGQLGDSYVSWGSLGRNAGLLLLAVVPLLITSDYFTLHRFLQGGALGPGEPAVSVLAPILLIWMATLVGLTLAVALWGSLSMMAHTEGGPAEDLPETEWMRRLLRVKSEHTLPESLERN